MNDRQRALANARRLRRGVVATGVAGSLGVAALVGLPALQQVAGSSQTGSAGQATSQYDGQQQASVRGGDGGEHGEHDGWAFDDDSGTVSQVPQQQQWNPPSSGFAPPAPSGGGAPHAGTMGS